MKVLDKHDCIIFTLVSKNHTSGLLSVIQGEGDQVKIGRFAAEAGKCHRPHHPLPREG